jgi:hypothetical protein
VSNDVKKVVERIAKVAKGAADAVAVTFGTVLSRNPDGSLNVDDGRGGCVRVMPAANVRVGQKIPIGTEPQIGTTTQLETRYVVVEPLGGCPADPRLDPTPTAPLDALTVRWTGENTRIPTWADRSTDYGTHVSGPSTTVAAAMRAYAQYRADGILICRRGFAEFPTAGLIPEGSELTSASLFFSISTGSLPQVDSAGKTFSYSDGDVVVVPSVAPHFGLSTPATSLITDAVIAEELGRFRIRDLAFGAVLYEIPLDVDVLTPYYNVGGATKVAIITQPDFDALTPSQDTGFTSGTLHFENITFGDVTYPYPKLVVGYQSPL